MSHLTHDLDQGQIWFVCKFCGRSSIRKEVIQNHEYEFHIQTENDMRRLKPNPSFLVKKNPKMEHNQYNPLAHSSMNSKESILLLPITVPKEQGKCDMKGQSQIRIEDFQVTSEMAHRLRKCLKDCIFISKTKSTVQSSVVIKMESNVSKNMSSNNINNNHKSNRNGHSGCFNSNEELEIESLSSSAIVIKMSPIPEEKDEENEEKEDEYINFTRRTTAIP